MSVAGSCDLDWLWLTSSPSNVAGTPDAEQPEPNTKLKYSGLCKDDNFRLMTNRIATHTRLGLFALNRHSPLQYARNLVLAQTAQYAIVRSFSPVMLAGRLRLASPPTREAANFLGVCLPAATFNELKAFSLQARRLVASTLRVR